MSILIQNPTMNSAVLLAELQLMANNIPDFQGFTSTSRQHFEWLGKTHALIARWNSMEANSFSLFSGFLSRPQTREGNLMQLMGILHRALADLQLETPSKPDQAFGPGAVYDFFKALRDLLSTASQTVMVVDPYLDDQVFDTYISGISSTASVKLLTTKAGEQFRPALDKYRSQHSQDIEARKTKAIHDRVVMIDGNSCWVLGQSINNAAKSKPTYIAPVSPDTAAEKIRTYQEIWNGSEPV
jgi:hypothetical protein